MSEKEKEQPIRVRRLTEEEVREKAHKIAKMAAAHLARYERRWEKSRHTDLDALHGALFLLQVQLPPWLFAGLHQVLERSMCGPSVDEVRWLMVRQALDHPEPDPDKALEPDLQLAHLTWEKAYAYASRKLAKTDARGHPTQSRRAIRKSSGACRPRCAGR